GETAQGGQAHRRRRQGTGGQAGIGDEEKVASAGVRGSRRDSQPPVTGTRNAKSGVRPALCFSATAGRRPPTRPAFPPRQTYCAFSNRTSGAVAFGMATM